MDLSAFLGTETFSLLVLPILIFLARIFDVTLGTMRIIYVSRGMRTLAPILGFFEVLVWIIAVGQIMQNLSNALNYVAYAAGFAAGNYVGMLVEERLAVGLITVRVITKKDASALRDHLKSEKFGVTSVSAIGASGRVRMIFSIIKRKDLPKVVSIIKKYNPKAFISVEEVRSVQEAIMPPTDLSGGYMRHFSLRKNGI